MVACPQVTRKKYIIYSLHFFQEKHTFLGVVLRTSFITYTTLTNLPRYIQARQT